MKHLAAYLLLVLGGNESPTAEDVNTLLTEVGAEVDAEKVEKVVSELSGKNINELIASGLSKVGTISGGGAAVGGAGGAAGGGAAAGGAGGDAVR